MVRLHLLADVRPPCSFIDTQFSGQKTSSLSIDEDTETLPTSVVLFLIIVNSFM